MFLVSEKDLNFFKRFQNDKNLFLPHGSGTWLYLKGNYYWKDPFLTFMIMGGSEHFLLEFGWLRSRDFFFQNIFVY